MKRLPSPRYASTIQILKSQPIKHDGSLTSSRSCFVAISIARRGSKGGHAEFDVHASVALTASAVRGNSNCLLSAFPPALMPAISPPLASATKSRMLTIGRRCRIGLTIQLTDDGPSVTRIPRRRCWAAVRWSVWLGRLMVLRFGAGPAFQKSTQRIRLLAQLRTFNVPN